MNEQHPLLRYRTPGQRKFNERFLPDTKSSPGPDIVNGPWMSNEVVTRLPGVRRDFEQSRDPNHARLMGDLQKSEVRTGNTGREEQTGRDSHMIKQDQPKAILRPPEEIRTPIDNQRFRNRWLKEQRDAAMAQHRPKTNHEPQSEHEQPSILPQYKTPER